MALGSLHVGAFPICTIRQPDGCRCPGIVPWTSATILLTRTDYSVTNPDIAKTHGLTSFRYLSDTFASDRYHIDVDPSVFAISVVRSVIWYYSHYLIEAEWRIYTHIYVSNLTIIGSDNGLSPGRRQAIIWTNAGILLIGPLGTNFSEILIEIQSFSFKKMHLKMSSGKWCPFCLGLNVLYKLCVRERSGVRQPIVFFVGGRFVISPWTKWPPFRRRYFQMHSCEWKVLCFD